MKKYIKYFKFLLLIILILILLTIIIFATLILKMHTSNNNQIYYDRGISILPNADYILVPGAKININLPETVLEHRLLYAYNLYKAGKAKKIIISGAFDEKIGKYESSIMSSYLIKLGVNEEDIISDLHGNNTYETIKRTKEFVGNKSIIFCTQEFYSYRAIYIANKLNLNMNVFCSNPIIYSYNFKTRIREYLSQIKAILDCNIIKPNTTSLTDVPFF